MRRRWSEIGLVSVAAGIVVAGAAAPSQSQVRAASGCPSASGATVVTRARVPGRPRFLFLKGNDLWVAVAAPRVFGRGWVARVDARSGRLERVLRLPVDPDQLAVGFGSLWVTGATNEQRYRGVLRIDPRSGRVLRVVRGPRALGSKLATTSRAVWVGGADIYPKGHSEKAGVRFVYEIDPRRNAVVRSVRLPGQATVISLVGDGSSLWSVGWWGVVKLSASGRVLFRHPIDGSGWSLALTPGVVWVAQPWLGERPVRRQDRPARRLLRIPVAAPSRATVVELETQPGGVSAAAGVVWVGGDGRLARLDAAQVPPTLTSVPLSLTPTYHVAVPGGAWIAERDANRVSKIC
jgi:hypothetical protein